MRSISFCKLELVLVIFLLEKNGFNLARACQVTSYVVTRTGLFLFNLDPLSFFCMEKYIDQSFIYVIPVVR